MVVLSGLTALIAPILLQVWETQNSELGLKQIIIIVVIIVFANLLNIAFTVYRERFAKEFNKKNFLTMMKSFCELKYDTLITKGPTNILEKITLAVNSVYTYMTGDFIQIYSSVFVAAVCMLLISFINIWLALLMLIVIPLNYFGYKLLNKKLTHLSQQMQIDTSAGFQEILSKTQHIDYIKQTAYHENLLNGLVSPAEKVYGSMAKVNEFAQSVSIGLKGLTDVVQNIIMLALIYFFSNNMVNSYALVLATFVLPLYFSSISTIVNSNINKRDFNVAVEFQNELDSEKEVIKKSDVSLDSISRMDMDVKELSILDKSIPFNAHGTFQKGDIIQICGTSGSGKSTFARALLKFRPVSSIKVNGIPIESISSNSIREKTEYVSQNIPIICGTLRENILINTNAGSYSDEKLISLPLLASILDNKTLDTVILENGANLSGGEKQKVALTRALLENPDVLILDEVCSNIDVHTTNDIYRFLNESRDSRITFIITHDDLPDGLANFKLNL